MKIAVGIGRGTELLSRYAGHHNCRIGIGLVIAIRIGRIAHGGAGRTHMYIAADTGGTISLSAFWNLKKPKANDNNDDQYTDDANMIFHSFPLVYGIRSIVSTLTVIALILRLKYREKKISTS